MLTKLWHKLLCACGRHEWGEYVQFGSWHRHTCVRCLKRQAWRSDRKPDSEAKP